MLRRLVALLAVAALAGGCSASGSGAAPGPRRTPSPTPSPAPAPRATPAALVLQDLGAFTTPVWAGAPPHDPGHLFLVQKGGQILQLDAAGHRLGVVLDLHDGVSHGSEQGLLSMAFDPAYPRVPRIYVDYTDPAGDTQVVAYAVERGQAVRPQRLLTVGQPYANHNGGLLLFDRTGMLLVALGDGGNAGDPQNRAQDLGSMLGKILRINPRTGAAAPDNPYPSNRYVWALGLRNPWRFSFDTNGDLYLGDVGQNKVEELDVVPPALQRGANYGWSVYEGNERFKTDEQFTPGGPLITPALTYDHRHGGCSITAGSVYHGHDLPELRGVFVYGDYCAGRLMGVRRTADGLGVPFELGVRAEGLQAFGLDGRGELLVLTVDRLSRLVAGG